MINKLTCAAATGLVSALLSTGAFAHVANGYLVDGSGNPVSSSYHECLRTTNGRDIPECDPAPAKAEVKPAPAPAPKPEPKREPTPVQEKVDQSISLAGDALFATNSAVLTDAGKASVDPVAVGVKDLSDYTISLYGHADSRGNDDYNMQLSERRAQAVADYLISKGVPAGSIFVFGRGETEPVASNATAEGRAKNRRVDVTVTGIKTTYKTTYK